MDDREPNDQYQPCTVRVAQLRTRGEQLARRRSELRAGKPITHYDADIADQRARSALLQAASAHEQTAMAHDRAADHSDADAVHRDAATAHRDAGDKDLRLALDD